MYLCMLNIGLKHQWSHYPLNTMRGLKDQTQDNSNYKAKPMPNYNHILKPYTVKPVYKTITKKQGKQSLQASGLSVQVTFNTALRSTVKNIAQGVPETVLRLETKSRGKVQSQDHRDHPPPPKKKSSQYLFYITSQVSLIKNIYLSNNVYLFQESK